MSVVVKTDRKKWAGVINNAAGKAAYALAEQILADSEQYVPYSGGSSQSAGNLRESGKVVKGDSGTMYVVWDTVYALYQWYGMRIIVIKDCHFLVFLMPDRTFFITTKETNL